MYKENDIIVYKKDVCKVIDTNDDYYVLKPINDETLTIKALKNSKLIRSLISIKEINKIINNIPNIKIINENDKLIENQYKELLKDGSFESLISIIKTTYLRNQKRINEKKKLSEKDKDYFILAEKYLYTEFSIVLNKSFEDTKKYVEECVKKYEISK
ncbi:MAG: hypothetical protein IJ568_00650 [Bacilli bacterium]|nr:hypothetical protein [Bacilli bacterium]